MAGNLAPENAHWLPRTPTWIRINAAENGEGQEDAEPIASPGSPGSSSSTSHAKSSSGSGDKKKKRKGSSTASGNGGVGSCTGFLTMLQPRNVSTPAVEVKVLEQFPGGQ